MEVTLILRFGKLCLSVKIGLGKAQTKNKTCLHPSMPIAGRQDPNRDALQSGVLLAL